MKNIIGLQSRLKAQIMGLIALEGDKITYKNANFSTKLSPEEQVRLDCFLYLTLIKNYPAELIDFEYRIRLGSSFIRADLVVWTNNASKDIFLILECKRQDCTQKALEEAQQQAFSYEKQVGANYLWVSNKSQNFFYETQLQKNGKKNYKAIADLPDFSTKRLFFRQISRIFNLLVFKLLANNSHEKV